MPLFFLSGMEGRMLQPLGISFLISLFASLIVAMTVTPLLSKILLSNEKYLKKNEKEKWLAAYLKRNYEKALQWSLQHKLIVLIPTLLLFDSPLFLGAGGFRTGGGDKVLKSKISRAVDIITHLKYKVGL